MNRRSLLFLAAAVVVAAGVIGIYMNYPPVDRQHAQGTIGAVQKYRSEQINSTGVVLGDEKTRKEEAAIYGDSLANAAKLQSFASEIGSIDRAATVAQARTQLASASQSIDGAVNDLGVRMLEAVGQLQMRQELASRHAALKDIENVLQNRQLNAKQIAGMQATLAMISNDLGMRRRLADAEQLGTTRRLAESDQAGAQLEMHALAEGLEMRRILDARTALGVMAKDLESRAAALNEKQIAAMREQLVALNSSFSEAAQNESRTLASTVQQLEGDALQAKSLLAARDEIASLDQVLAAKTLQEKDSAAAALASRNMSFDRAASQLAEQAAVLESSALRNVQSRLAMRQAEAESMVAMRASLDSLSRVLANRNILAANAALESVKPALASAQKSIDGAAAQLAQRFTLNARMELAAMDQFLNSRAALASKNQTAVLASAQAVESVESRTLASRNLANRTLQARNDEGMAMYSRTLGSVSASVAEMAQSVDNRAALAAREIGEQAAALGNRRAKAD